MALSSVTLTIVVAVVFYTTGVTLSSSSDTNHYRNHGDSVNHPRRHHHQQDADDVLPVVKKLQRGRNRRAKSDDGLCDLEIHCSGNHDDLRLPLRRPISADVGAVSPDHQLTGTSAVGHGGHVAFFVGLSGNMGPVQENTDVKFDRVVTNVGGAYDELSGRFTAPTTGVYQFHVVISAQGRQKAAVMLLKNGEMVTTVWAESVPSWSTSSNVAVLQLTAGDSVWLSLLNRASYLHGYMYSTFSGFQIFAE